MTDKMLRRDFYAIWAAAGAVDLATFHAPAHYCIESPNSGWNWYLEETDADGRQRPGVPYGRWELIPFRTMTTKPRCPYCHHEFGWPERFPLLDDNYACPACRMRVVLSKQIYPSPQPWNWAKPTKEA